MIDIKFLRENPEKVKENIKKKFQDNKIVLVDEIIELDKKNREAKFVMICSRLDKSVMGCISFFAQTIRSMYHLATGSICVLDSYWPAVSMCAWYKEI